MKDMTDFDHIQSGKRTEMDNEQEPRGQKLKSLRPTTVCNMVQHTARGSAQHLGKHAVHVGSRTISKWYARASGNECEHDQHPAVQRHAPDVHRGGSLYAKWRGKQQKF